MKRRTILLIGILGLVIFSALTHRQSALTVVYDPYGWYYAHDAGQQLVDLQVPDSVVTYGSALRVKIPATNVSLMLPDGYEQMVDFRGYTNGDSCIKVIEDHRSGIAARRKEIDTYIAYTRHEHHQDESGIYLKDFKFNGYDAFIVCVSDTTRTKTAIYMAFGDDRFNVSMTGTMAANTEENRKELVNTMLTAFYQKA